MAPLIAEAELNLPANSPATDKPDPPPHARKELSLQDHRLIDDEAWDHLDENTPPRLSAISGEFSISEETTDGYQQGVSIHSTPLTVTEQEGDHNNSQATSSQRMCTPSTITGEDSKCPSRREEKQGNVETESAGDRVTTSPDTLHACASEAEPEEAAERKLLILGRKHSNEPESPPREKETVTTTQTLTNQNHKAVPSKFFAALCFEMKFVGLASATLACYCMAHLAIYELIYALLLEMTEMRIQNMYLLYSVLMVMGVACLRATGFLWYFLSSKRYRQTKAELKERRKQGSCDAMLYDWLDERPCRRTALEVVGFYLCYISLAFFWTKFLTCFVDQREAIYARLPSAQYYREQVASDDNATLDGDCGVESEINWSVEDYEFIYQTVAKSSYYQYSGSQDAPLFSAPLGLLVYVCTVAVSLLFLSKMGLSFVDNW